MKNREAYSITGVNYYVLKHIQDNTDIKKTGIIAMDFPGDKLINEIINVNKR
ncbi:hypothetical protein [Tenacibaculum sediminilitoris]|uniref:hypothetical protein n=1 Tax=Tenacibaculum sediminilitoris TaxID=1820334 RepID=UPI0038B5CEF3